MDQGPEHGLLVDLVQHCSRTSSGSTARHEDIEGSRESRRPSVLAVGLDNNTYEQLCAWLAAGELSAIHCPKADEAVSGCLNHAPDCVLVNADLVGGPDSEALIQALVTQNGKLPIIVTSTCAEVPFLVRLMRAGARDFLPAPITPAMLISSVRYHLQSRRNGEYRDQRGVRMGRSALLSPREREILEFVVRGFSTKQIAAAVGRVEKTVEFHRHNLMRKMGASNAAQLVHLAMLERE